MSEIKKLARLGGDVRKIAALLQSKGRGNDTILAHITPQEAALLRARGGSGTTNPETGLLEFQTEDEQALAYMPAPEPQFDQADLSQFGLTQQDVIAQPTMVQQPEVVETPIPFEFQITPEQVSRRMAQEPLPDFGFQPSIPEGPQMAVPQFRPETFLESASRQTGMSEDFLKRLGLAGLQAIPGAMQVRRAQREAGAQRAELERIAAPYRSRAQALTAQAQAGQLTPEAQQQLQAARAQLAQGVARRGGVGAQQTAIQLEQFRQQLLQKQLDMGLQLSGIADRIQMGAIRAGYQADEQVQQMTQNFTNNLFRTLFAQPGQQQPAPRA